MVVGNLNGQLVAAARIAMGRGVAVRHADGVDTALAVLQQGRCSDDLVIVDAAADAAGVVTRLAAAGVAVPVVVVCGTGNDARTAAAAAAPGAFEYLALPARAEAIAAILAAVADDDGDALAPAVEDGTAAERGLRRAQAALAAAAVPPDLVGRTVAAVERDLILETLRCCCGNRTHAAAILGISVRTLRNKLTVYAAEGIDVPPPNQGEIRGAA